MTSLTPQKTPRPSTPVALQKALNLASPTEVTLLLESDPIKESFRQYRNHYLNSHKTAAEDLGSWHAVDEYLWYAKLDSLGRTTEELVRERGHRDPYARSHHVALFVLRVVNFLKSPQGRRFDVPRREEGGGGGSSEAFVDAKKEQAFERCRMGVSLLGFLVKTRIERK